MFYTIKEEDGEEGSNAELSEDTPAENIYTAKKYYTFNMLALQGE